MLEKTGTYTETYIDQSRISVKDGQVQLILPGKLDLAALTRDLQQQGYFTANDPADTDSQGWGEQEDPEGYYPYWVFRDDQSWVFAFTPEGLQADEDLNSITVNKTQDLIRHWATYLGQWCK